VEQFRQQLDGHAIVGLDTSVFIYHLEAHPRYQPLTQELLAGVQAGRQTAVTSVITVMELTVRPWRLGRSAVAREYEALLFHFPNLVLADVTRAVARRAAQLRARYSVRPADALQAATALLDGATAFVTNDRKLARLAPELDVLVLESYVGT
jgi:predicted nucleic acid-binding protein